MKIFEFPFPIEIGQVADVDFTPKGETLSIQGSFSQQVLLWGDRRLPLPADWSCPEFPFVRGLPDGRALLVDSGFKAGARKNAWIINSKGEIVEHFALGAAAVEVAPLLGLIAVAFHPISARAHGYQVQPLQRAAIVFFNYRGQMVMGFNQEAALYGVMAENVRCLSVCSPTKLIFVPERLTVKGEEVANPVVVFDCASRRPRIYSAPVGGAEAITMDLEGWIHLASPEGSEDQIITFDPERKISQHRGEFLGIFRGLEGGGFLAQTSAADYALLIPEAPIDSSVNRLVDGVVEGLVDSKIDWTVDSKTTSSNDVQIERSGPIKLEITKVDGKSTFGDKDKVNDIETENENVNESQSEPKPPVYRDLENENPLSTH